MENFKKILTIILSISLLFLVSCGNDDKTGSGGGSGKGDALLNSVPKVTGEPTQDFSTATTYNATLNIVDTKEDTDFTDDFLSYTGKTREQLIEEAKAKQKNIILTITKNAAGNNIVKFSEQSTATEGSGFPKEYPLFENAELKKDSSGKYNAGVENPTENGTQIYYIEFDKTTSKIKFVNAISQNVDWGDIGSKYTYEGPLTEKPSGNN